MAQSPPSVGDVSWGDFHGHCLYIVRATATDINTQLARSGGTVRVDTKTSYAGEAAADIFTAIDMQAQKVMAGLILRRLPPEVGQIGEENQWQRPSTFRGYSVVLTIDPVDGTRRLVDLLETGRRPGPGDVSVMLGVQVNGQPVAGYACDIATLSTYCRAPYSPRVVMVTQNNVVTPLSEMRRAVTLRSGILLWHGKRNPTSPITATLMKTAFGRFDRGRSSIGLTVLGVFDGRFAAVLRPAGSFSTPWDDTPLQAMIDTGEVLMLRLAASHLAVMRFTDLSQNLRCNYDILYIHRRYMGELTHWAQRQGLPIVGLK